MMKSAAHEGTATKSNLSNDTKQQPNKIAAAMILFFCLVIFLFRVSTAHNNAITYDEPVYLRASQAYVFWAKEAFYSFLSGNFLAPFSRQQIDRYWERHQPHPPLSKTLNGITWFFFSPIFGDLASLRAGSAFAYACLFGLVLFWSFRLLGWAGAVASALMLLINPRLFFYGGSAYLDMIGMMLSFATIFYFWKSSEQIGWIPLIICGLLWGMANSAKNTAYLLLPVLTLWPLIWRRTKPLFLRLIAMQFIALLVFLILWPWLYHETLSRLHTYSQFSGISILWERYLKFAGTPNTSTFNLVFDERTTGGQSFPWYYSFTIIYAVVPAFTLILVAAGTIYFIFRARNSELALIVLGAWAPVITTCLPSAPVYDMERFLILAFPFQALLSAVVVIRFTEWLSQKFSWTLLKVRAVAFIVLAIFFVPTAKEWMYLHPQELSYFNAFVGGLPGAAKKGYPPTYALASTNGVFQYLNEKIPDGSRVAPGNRLVFNAYKEFGFVKEELGYCRTVSADAAERCNYLIRQEPIKENERTALKKLYTFALHGVPLTSIYEVKPEYINLLRERDLKRIKKSLRGKQDEEDQPPL